MVNKIVLREITKDTKDVKRLVKVDSTGEPLNTASEYVVIEDAAQVEKEGTPITQKVIDAINWREDSSLEFKKRLDNEMPEGNGEVTQIVTLSDGATYLIPAGKGAVRLDELKGASEFENLTIEENLEVGENLDVREKARICDLEVHGNTELYNTMITGPVEIMNEVNIVGANLYLSNEEGSGNIKAQGTIHGKKVTSDNMEVRDKITCGSIQTEDIKTGSNRVSGTFVVEGQAIERQIVWL